MQFDSFILLILVILLLLSLLLLLLLLLLLGWEKNRSSVFEFNAYYLRLFLISFHFLFPRSSFMRK